MRIDWLTQRIVEIAGHFRCWSSSATVELVDDDSEEENENFINFRSCKKIDCIVSVLLIIEGARRDDQVNKSEHQFSHQHKLVELQLVVMSLFAIIKIESFNLSHDLLTL